jgi:hypothetical protein
MTLRHHQKLSLTQFQFLLAAPLIFLLTAPLIELQSSSGHEVFQSTHMRLLPPLLNSRRDPIQLAILEVTSTSHASKPEISDQQEE